MINFFFLRPCSLEVKGLNNVYFQSQCTATESIVRNNNILQNKNWAFKFTVAKEVKDFFIQENKY